MLSLFDCIIIPTSLISLNCKLTGAGTVSLYMFLDHLLVHWGKIFIVASVAKCCNLALNSWIPHLFTAWIIFTPSLTLKFTSATTKMGTQNLLG